MLAQAPLYNILKKAGSLAGFKHSKKTLIKMRARVHTLEQRVRYLEAMKIVHSDEEYRAKRLEDIMRYNASEKKKEDMKRFSHSVEVTNTLTNVKDVYSSIAEAARAIGCNAASTISIALKEFKEKGKYRLVKKIYLITLKECNVKDEKSIVSSDSYSVVSSTSKKVKILDISNGNIATYFSFGEAAKATGCHKTTISKALACLKEVDSIIIKKRYKILGTW